MPHQLQGACFVGEKKIDLGCNFFSFLFFFFFKGDLMTLNSCAGLALAGHPGGQSTRSPCTSPCRPGDSPRRTVCAKGLGCNHSIIREVKPHTNSSTRCKYE